MDIAELRAFVAVAEELHFGRAAKRLHMAQPPVSRTVRHLEQEVGVALFIRSTRSVELTPAGAALLEPARDVLAAHARAELAARSAAAGGGGVVRVVYTGASTQAVLAELAVELGERHPEVSLTLIGSTYGRAALELMRTGGAEAALGRWESLPADVEHLAIVDEELVLVLPEHHRLARADRVALRDLVDDAFLTLPEDSFLVELLRRHAAQAGFIPRIAQTAPDTATLIAMVRAGMGITLTVSSVRAAVQGGGVIFVGLDPEPAPVQLRLAWQTDAVTPALAAVLEVARRTWPVDSDSASTGTE